MSQLNRQPPPACRLLGILLSLWALPQLLAQTEDRWTAVRGEAGENVRVASRPPDASALSSVAQTGKLPNDHGQVWREYDIRTFTRQMDGQEKPEQTVVDWILRETGTDTWFGDPISLLSVSRDAVRVYHTPLVQQIVSEVVDRFVNTRREANQVVVRLITVGSPDWRLKALPMLRPVPVQTPGMEAWLLSREDAALLLAELNKRTDYREYNSPNLTIYNGQTHTISSSRPRTFVSGINAPASGGPSLGEVGQIDEGFSLQISPLVARDQRTIDASVRCSVDQVERFTSLWVDAPDGFGSRRRVQIQVPQVSSWRVHERFRWPTNEVLLISRGVVATPGPAGKWTGSLAKLFDGSPPRANALLFLESRSEVPSAARSQPAAIQATRPNYRGRY